METSAKCSLCGPIPDYASEYHSDWATEHWGGGQKLAPQVSLLKPHKVHHTYDFLECPKCGALFLLENDIAATGSGDYDQSVVTRLSAEDTAVLREILHRAGLATEDPAGLAGRLLGLPDDVLNLAGIHLWERDRELARRLLPALVDHYAAHGGGVWPQNWPWRFLYDFTTTQEDATLLLGELDRHPATPDLDRLRAFARVTVCSICRSIDTDAPTKIRLGALPPGLRALRRFGVSAHIDVWECPECDSLHFCESEDGIDGGLFRVGWMQDRIRPYLRRPESVEAKVIDDLFGHGGASERFIVTLGMRKDPDLVRPLVPRMVRRLANKPARWLHDALCELAQDPATAASVLASIAKLNPTNALVDSLAARARAV